MIWKKYLTNVAVAIITPGETRLSRIWFIVNKEYLVV